MRSVSSLAHLHCFSARILIQPTRLTLTHSSSPLTRRTLFAQTFLSLIDNNNTFLGLQSLRLALCLLACFLLSGDNLDHDGPVQNREQPNPAEREAVEGPVLPVGREVIHEGVDPLLCDAVVPAHDKDVPHPKGHEVLEVRPGRPNARTHGVTIFREGVEQDQDAAWTMDEVTNKPHGNPLRLKFLHNIALEDLVEPAHRVECGCKVQPKPSSERRCPGRKPVQAFERSSEQVRARCSKLEAEVCGENDLGLVRQEDSLPEHRSLVCQGQLGGVLVQAVAEHRGRHRSEEHADARMHSSPTHAGGWIPLGEPRELCEQSHTHA
mmetsp:Transcript_7067/g.17565  ORF Transcript_7067/g.17565 Transcript_7067/m.17565 type:complete len:323 (-) Transcript_7067:10-978(-)